MEIHPPEHPILSLREFFVHIGTVTIGILIALSLEGLVEWNHHRHLVGEARENIRAELEDNQRELSSHLATTPDVRKNHQVVLRWIADVEKSHRSSIHSLSINFNLADLQSTSWTSAQAVGALALMDYAEVKRDAAVYQLQEEFLRLQRQAEDQAIGALTLFSASSDDPTTAPLYELQDERKKIENSLTALFAQEQIGKQLQAHYGEWLKAK